MEANSNSLFAMEIFELMNYLIILITVTAANNFYRFEIFFRQLYKWYWKARTIKANDNICEIGEYIEDNKERFDEIWHFIFLSVLEIAGEWVVSQQELPLVVELFFVPEFVVISMVFEVLVLDEHRELREVVGEDRKRSHEEQCGQVHQD